MVKARGDVSALHSRDILDSLRDKHPLLEISSQADLADDLEGEVDRLLGLFGGLLGMTVLIALFGIANTMSLAVVERTRESALMRAIGLSRWRLRVMLLLEAVVLGVVASLVGTALGLFFGRVIMLKAMGDIGAVIVFPWLWLAVLIAAAALASALAAVFAGAKGGRGIDRLRHVRPVAGWQYPAWHEVQPHPPMGTRARTQAGTQARTQARTQAADPGTAT